MKLKKSKTSYLLALFFFLGICGGLYLLLKRVSDDKAPSRGFLTKEVPYFVPLNINGFSSADIPYLKIDIENKTVTAKIDLGYEGDISLPAHILEEIQGKKFIKNQPCYGLGGKTYYNDLYEVEKIRIQNMTFFPVRAEEMNLECERDIKLEEKKTSPEHDFARLGWCLFYTFNLLIDCKHSTLALCDSIKTLEKQGYPVASFTEVPLLLERGFIEFESITRTGLLRCVLDTGSTWNMLNKDLENTYNEHMIFTTENESQNPTLNLENKNLISFDSKKICELATFSIGGKEFGPTTFNQIRSPLAIDAIIGMEFFKTTLIFIDFSNYKLYFYEYPE